MLAKSKTPAKKYLSAETGRCRLPIWEPASPPANATRTNRTISVDTLNPEIVNPMRPDMELTTIKAADKKAVSLIVAHRIIIKIGDRMIPPPIPIIPEKKPMVAPVKNAAGKETLRMLYSLSLSVSSIRTIPIISTTPSKTLYKPTSAVIIAPIKAEGTEPRMKGYNFRMLNFPAP